MATQRLRLERPPPSNYSGWLAAACIPNNNVVWLDTQSVSFNAQPGVMEASLVASVASALVHCGASVQQIGVIAPYRQQVATLASAAHLPKGIVPSTVDRYQGGEVDALILALSVVGAEATSLLSDWRRINVAVTRARRKMIIISPLQQDTNGSVIHTLVTTCIRKGWVHSVSSS